MYVCMYIYIYVYIYIWADFCHACTLSCTKLRLLLGSYYCALWTGAQVEPSRTVYHMI